MLEILFRNWPFKLLSLVLAFALWVAVTGENVIEDKLEELIGDEARLAVLGTEARRQVEARYTWAGVADAYEDLLRDLC